MKEENTDRMTKWRTDSIYSPKDLNLHDPHNQYRWQDEEANAPAWVWAMRVLGTFLVFICSLFTFLCGYLYAHFTHVSVLRGNYYGI
jgi:hypothetical protein